MSFVTRLRLLLKRRHPLAVPLTAGYLLARSAHRHRWLTGFALALCSLALGTSIYISSHLTTVSHASKSAGEEEDAATTYTVTDLGTLPGYAETYAAGINDKGQIVGNASNGRRTARPFLWQKGTLTALETPENSMGYVVGINDRETMAGARYRGEYTTDAVLWKNGKVRVLKTLGDLTTVTHINKNDQIVGASGPTKESYAAACAWFDNQVKDLGVNYEYSYANGINDDGAIVGTTKLGMFWWAFEIRNSRYRWLNSLAGTGDVPFAVNNKNQIVGLSEYDDDFHHHAVLWENDKIRDLGTLGGTDSAAYGINEKGVVVGKSQIRNGTEHAFSWKKGKMTDLNRLIPDASGWTLKYANAINNVGQIVGTGTHDGQTRAFLLTPK